MATRLRRDTRGAVGDKFGNWEIIEPPVVNGRNRQAVCRCQCGNVARVYMTNLLRGGSRGCRACSVVPRRSMTFREAEAIRARNTAPGTRYGGWEVIGPTEPPAVDRVKCRCECGTVSDLLLTNLLRGKTSMCRDCYAIDGMCNSPEWYSWQAMKSRCENANANGYALYGGRGIRVCEQWKGFKAFYADMGPRPEGTSLDRIDGNGHYEPGNCRWATPLQQGENRRDARVLTIGGRSLHIAAWARESGVCHATISSRLDRGWPADRAVNEPPGASKARSA
jgi:hypothetical protein